MTVGAGWGFCRFQTRCQTPTCREEAILTRETLGTCWQIRLQMKDAQKKNPLTGILCRRSGTQRCSQCAGSERPEPDVSCPRDLGRTLSNVLSSWKDNNEEKPKNNLLHNQ